MEIDQLQAKELKQHVDELVTSALAVEEHFKTLEAKQDQLIRELDQVDQEIAVAKEQINNYPIAIQEKTRELAASGHRQHQSISKVSGSIEEDLQLIADVDQIRLRAV